MYSTATCLILIFMIISGAARTILNKLFFQLGFEYPLFVTLLYLLGNALAWPLHYILHPFLTTNTPPKPVATPATLPVISNQAAVNKNIAVDVAVMSEEGRLPTDSSDANTTVINPDASEEGVPTPTTIDSISREQDGMKRENRPPSSRRVNLANANGQQQRSRRIGGSKRAVMGGSRLGSVTGLTDKSTQAAAWIHRIPWYLKPLVPGIFRFAKSALRTFALLYAVASVAEILISGLDLILSVVASKIIRKRNVPKMRWVGVGIVSVAVVVVGVADSFGASTNSDDSSSALYQVIGILLILGQSVLTQVQVVTEEMFLQEAAFPPMLLLGMEGAFGFVVGAVLYYPLAPLFGEEPSEVFDTLANTPWFWGYAVMLTFVFMAVGVFSILAVGKTSSISSTVWQNIRTVVVWTVGLVIHYATGDDDLGETWRTPNSYFILLGFCIMLAGISVYYKAVKPPQKAEPAAGAASTASSALAKPIK